MRILRCLLALNVGLGAAISAPVFLDERFELPAGFRIYRAAPAGLGGGCYDIAFDGQGRLLVGDGKAIRRLFDDDSDGVYDRFEIIAEGLGPRGPQGMLVYDDKLYATGGDGVQLYTGVLSGGPLLHRGRLGAKFSTGGDHTAHTLLRGLDGYVYFNTGDGAGIGDRTHITKSNSPVLFERKASVFRIDPNGHEWECVSAGGRNPPSLGMNYLGELFSWDSDMEWHVDLPWYRPVRLNHWITGADQGWQGVGAYPPYFIDNIPPVTEVGRGSPTWGVFYEHLQFPAKYADSFIVCDYRWKSATSGGYDSAGRLVSFHLTRNGSGWDAKMELLARPRPGAKDENGDAINFALVDAEVAPDGSLYVSDHNQGIWRILYDPQKSGASPPVFDFDKLASLIPNAQRMQAIDAVMLWPQPGAEWSRTTLENIHSQSGESLLSQLQQVALNESALPRKRARAIRLLAAKFADLPADFLFALAASPAPESRGQAAWLIGIRGRKPENAALLKLLGDSDAFVRRRAAEAFTRVETDDAVDALIERLSDSDRTVRYVAMSALAHRDPKHWIERALKSQHPQTLMRALVAYSIRRETPPQFTLERVIVSLLGHPGMTSEDRLDFLRVLGIHRDALREHPALGLRIKKHIAASFPDGDKNLRWEQARLIGEYGVVEAGAKLLGALETETDHVTQFHLAQAVSRIVDDLDDATSKRAINWFVKSQKGWFAESTGKGRQFPDFWGTVLAEFTEYHGAALAKRIDDVELTGQLGRLVLEWIGDQKDGDATLLGLYQKYTEPDTRERVVEALRNVRKPTVSAFLREEVATANNEAQRGSLLQALAKQESDPANTPLLLAGLAHSNPEVAGACAIGVGNSQAAFDEALAATLMNLMSRHAGLIAPTDEALRKLSKARSPWAQKRPRRPSGAERKAVIDFWKNWFAKQYGRPFLPGPSAPKQKSNEELFDFLMSDKSKGGDAKRGREVYLKAQCAECHGRGEKPGLLFGPDLAGAAQRLNRKELAEAIVYPSRVVVERFKAMEVELKDGESLTGFITEQTDQFVTLATKEKIHRIPRSKVEGIRPQSLSLMPEGALAALTEKEIRDLIGCLKSF